MREDIWMDDLLEIDNVSSKIDNVILKEPVM